MTVPQPPQNPGYHPQPPVQSSQPFSVSNLDTQAAMQTYAEVSPDLRPAVVESFLDQVERQAMERVRQDMVAQRRNDGPRPSQLALAITSLVMAIPITGVATAFEPFSLLAMIIAWTGIVAINVAYAMTARRRRD